MISQEEIFRQKAPHYLLCFIERCPLREHCLRWLVGRQADATTVSVTSVNPLLAQAGTDQCPQYRENVTAPPLRRIPIRLCVVNTYGMANGRCVNLCKMNNAS